MLNLSKQSTLEQATFLLEYFRHKLNDSIDDHARARQALAHAKEMYKSQEKIVRELRASGGSVE